MRTITLAGSVGLLCLCALLAALGLSIRSRALARRPAVNVNFCTLAKHQDTFWDRQLQVSADYIPGAERSFLSDSACPDAFVPYEISSDPSDEAIASRLLAEQRGTHIKIAFEATLIVRPAMRDWWRQLLRTIRIGSPYPGTLLIKNIRLVPSTSSKGPI